MEMRVVRRGVEFTDESLVLIWSGLNLEAVYGAIVGRADELVPVPAWSFSVLHVGGDVLQIFATVAVTQESGHLRVGHERNIFGALDRVQVCDQRYGDPVVSAHTVIPAEDDSCFSRGARTQDQGGIGADAR